MIHGIDRASQLRREEPIFHILHLWRTHHEAPTMDVYDGGQWGVGGDRAIRQNTDRLCAKRTLDMDFIGGDIRQVRYGNGGYQRQRTGAELPQSFGGQRWQWRPLRERIA